MTQAATATTPSNSEREKQLVEFKQSLVEDVFGKNNNGKVQMEKVTMLIWQFRDDPRVVNFVAQFVAKYSGSRDVFDGIEFYLPQLAHMIIHLEVDWDDAILERFALIISQQSLHFALQFNWILQGAIEDYQPETAEGLPNPAFNAQFYTRCVKLLSNIERCVVYGTPRTSELQRMYEKGKISKEEYELLDLADRRFNAAQLTEEDAVSQRGTELQVQPEGWLLYKRKVRKAAYRRKPWKNRYFVTGDRMLYCYDAPPQDKGVLIRAMPLEGAKVIPLPEGKYPYMIQVENQHYVFTMRAADATEAERWMEQLKDEAQCTSLFGDPLMSSIHSSNNGEQSNNTSVHGHVLNDLTPSQKARYDFYKGERNFVRDMCDVAETLRFKERDERKKLAPKLMRELKIPSCAYIPMCNSADSWRRVHVCIPDETKVFNTKERCPVYMHFLTKRGEDGKSETVDVATYLKEKFEDGGDQNRIATIEEENEEDGDLTIDAASLPPPVTRIEQPSTQQEFDKGKGNKQVQNFVKEHALQMMPNNLLRALKNRKLGKSTKSVYDMATLPSHSLKIVESARSWDDDDDAISVYDVKEQIDQDCLDRARDIICKETWEEKSDRILREALTKGLTAADGNKYEVQAVFAKSNDDLRQEVFVMQMIHYYKSVFANEGLPIWLHTYRILSTSKDTGLIEVICNATSIDGLKKSDGFPEDGSLLTYFQKVYGKETRNFYLAQRNFMLSLVGYSLVSYLLGLKDRHNGNIMITTKGHLVYIDFGFAMGMAPGHEFSLERSPFKLNKDYMDVMGGEKSTCFAEFKRLFVAGFEATRKKSQIAMGLVEIMMFKSNFPCFSGARYGDGISMKRFEDRLMLDVPDEAITKKALGLIEAAMHSNGTVLYDKFQFYSNGYIP